MMKKTVEYTSESRVSIMSPANRVGLVRTSKMPIASKVSEIGIENFLENAMEEFDGGTWLWKFDAGKLL